MKEVKIIALWRFENMGEATTEASMLIAKKGYDAVRIMSRTGYKCVKIVRA